MKGLKVIISGGGTGGHIFPAIAIANAIKARQINAEILFVGAKGKMEMEKVPNAGYKIIGLWISGFQRRFVIKNFLFPLKVILGLIKAGILIRKFKPDVVIGVGGFASGLTLKIASFIGIPTIILRHHGQASAVARPHPRRLGLDAGHGRIAVALRAGAHRGT